MKTAICILGVLGSIAVVAQETPRYAFNVGGGFTQPLGSTGSQLDKGWGLAAGAGVNFNQNIGLMADVGYNSFGVSSNTLNLLGFPGGNLKVFSATLNPVIHILPRGRVDLYLTGGGGYYRPTQEFTQPGVAGVVGYSPFFGFYRGLVPTTEVLSSYTTNKPGVDAGIGFSVGTKWRGKLYGEARVNRIFAGNNRYIDYIPVTFGYRF
ncbi:MAG: outer membrane beta-barrel protein [Bryobacteraceae bacterium]